MRLEMFGPVTMSALLCMLPPWFWDNIVFALIAKRYIQLQLTSTQHKQGNSNNEKDLSNSSTDNFNCVGWRCSCCAAVVSHRSKARTSLCVYYDTTLGDIGHQKSEEERVEAQEEEAKDERNSFYWSLSLFRNFFLLPQTQIQPLQFLLHSLSQQQRQGAAVPPETLNKFSSSFCVVEYEGYYYRNGEALLILLKASPLLWIFYALLQKLPKSFTSTSPASSRSLPLFLESFCVRCYGWQSPLSNGIFHTRRHCDRERAGHAPSRHSEDSASRPELAIITTDSHATVGGTVSHSNNDDSRNYNNNNGKYFSDQAQFNTGASDNKHFETVHGWRSQLRSGSNNNTAVARVINAAWKMGSFLLNIYLVFLIVCVAGWNASNVRWSEYRYVRAK